MTSHVSRVRRMWIRTKQLGMVGFIALNSTFLVQNLAYPEGLEPWKRTYKALLGMLIFCAGFAVAKALFDFYQAEIRGAGLANPAPEVHPEQPAPPQEPDDVMR